MYETDVRQHRRLMPLGGGITREEHKTSCGREAATICPASVTLTFDLLTLKVVSESRVTWATSVPILVFLGLSVLDLGPIGVRDKQTSDSIIA